MKLFVLLILTVFASEKEENSNANGPKCEEAIKNDEKNQIVVKIEEDEYAKKKAKILGVSYNKHCSKWCAQRWSKNGKKTVYNGFYNDKETAAHASDTLANQLMKNGEQGHKINFPDDYFEVYPEEKTTTSKYIGVSYDKNKLKWGVHRQDKKQKKTVHNGYYDFEETAAHASDTLARLLMENGEQRHKLNFPDDHTAVYRKEKKSKYIGVAINDSKWRVQRWSKDKNKIVYHGYHIDEETAAHASDTLARKLMKNGEQGHKLNFPDTHIKVYTDENQKKRKRQKALSFEHPQNN